MAEISLRAVVLVPERNGNVLPHFALDRPDRALRGQRVLVARGAADQQFACGSRPTTDGRMGIAVLGQHDRDAPASMTATSLFVVSESIPMIVSLVALF